LSPAAQCPLSGRKTQGIFDAEFCFWCSSLYPTPWLPCGPVTFPYSFYRLFSVRQIRKFSFSFLFLGPPFRSVLFFIFFFLKKPPFNFNCILYTVLLHRAPPSLGAFLPDDLCSAAWVHRLTCFSVLIVPFPLGPRVLRPPLTEPSVAEPYLPFIFH